MQVEESTPFVIPGWEGVETAGGATPSAAPVSVPKPTAKVRALRCVSLTGSLAHPSPIDAASAGGVVRIHRLMGRLLGQTADSEPKR